MSETILIAAIMSLAVVGAAAVGFGVGCVMGAHRGERPEAPAARRPWSFRKDPPPAKPPVVNDDTRAYRVELEEQSKHGLS